MLVFPPTMLSKLYWVSLFILHTLLGWCSASLTFRLLSFSFWCACHIQVLYCSHIWYESSYFFYAFCVCVCSSWFNKCHFQFACCVLINFSGGTVEQPWLLCNSWKSFLPPAVVEGSNIYLTEHFNWRLLQIIFLGLLQWSSTLAALLHWRPTVLIRKGIMLWE